jgi:hypothetical protein
MVLNPKEYLGRPQTQLHRNWEGATSDVSMKENPIVRYTFKLCGTIGFLCPGALAVATRSA